MRLKGLSLLLLLLIPVQGYEVTVILKNYDSGALLSISNGKEAVFSGLVFSGDRIPVEGGNYTFELSALNKTFIKKLRVEENQTVEFNLGFTNSTEFLAVTFHASVLRNGSVDEVIVVTNRGELNFEGDLTIPMPAFTNFQLITNSLDFLSIEVLNESITFRSLLVPENESGIIRIAYTLPTEEMIRKLSGERVVIIPDAEVLEYRNLSYREQQFNGERIGLLEGNGSYYVKFRFLDYSVSFISLAAILLISASLFLVFFERRGRWGE